MRVVVSGAGAAGVAVARILLEAGVGDIAVVDRQGVLHSARGRPHPGQAGARRRHRRPAPAGTASLADALAGADVFIGVSGGTVPEEVVATMAADAIIFALANPTPEVHPDVAHRHARVVATGRSDFPNQINNVLAFPGIFRGAFDVARHRDHRGHEARRRRRARRRWSATTSPRTCIVPSPFDPRVGPAVAAAVAAAARARRGRPRAEPAASTPAAG